MTHPSRLVLIALTLFAGTALVQAGDRPADKYQGTWVHRGDDHKVILEIEADTLRCTIATADGMTVTVEADYVVSKDGILLGVIRPFKKMDKEEDRDLMRERVFSLLVSATEKTLTVKEVECKRRDVDELIQGTYKKTTADKVNYKMGPSPEKKTGKKSTCCDSGAAIGAGVGALIGARCGQESHYSGMTLPSGRYLQQPPQYVPGSADLPVVLSKEKPTFGAADLVQIVLALFQKWAPNPTQRINELLNQSEDLQPSHLTPERTHDGIQ